MPTVWWLDTLKRIEKIIRESAFDKKKKKPWLKFNPGFALSGVRTTGPWLSRLCCQGNVNAERTQFWSNSTFKAAGRLKSNPLVWREVTLIRRFKLQNDCFLFIYSNPSFDSLPYFVHEWILESHANIRKRV